MLSFSLVAEALTGLIYHRPSGENSSFAVVHTCLMMGKASLETSPKNNMIQDMINSNNVNSTESTIPNIFKIDFCQLCGFDGVKENIHISSFGIRKSFISFPFLISRLCIN